MLIGTPTTTLQQLPVRPAEAWRHQSEPSSPPIPFPSLYTHFIRAQRGGSEASCAAWGRLHAASLPKPFLVFAHMKAVIINSFAPATTLLFELLVFGTFISSYEALGGTIMLVGILWVFLPGLHRKASNLKVKVVK